MKPAAPVMSTFIGNSRTKKRERSSGAKPNVYFRTNTSERILLRVGSLVVYRRALRDSSQTRESKAEQHLLGIRIEAVAVHHVEHPAIAATPESQAHAVLEELLFEIVEARV